MEDGTGKVMDEFHDKKWMIIAGAVVLIIGMCFLFFFNMPIYAGVIIFIGLVLAIIGVSGTIDHEWTKAWNGM